MNKLNHKMCLSKTKRKKTIEADILYKMEDRRHINNKKYIVASIKSVVQIIWHM